MEVDADLADLYYENGTVKPVHEWPLIWRTGLVLGIDVEELWEGAAEKRELVGQRVKTRLVAARFSRLLAIGKHVKVNAFKEIVEHDARDLLKEAFEAMSKTATVSAPWNSLEHAGLRSIRQSKYPSGSISSRSLVADAVLRCEVRGGITPRKIRG